MCYSYHGPAMIFRNLCQKNLLTRTLRKLQTIFKLKTMHSFLPACYRKLSSLLFWSLHQHPQRSFNVSLTQQNQQDMSSDQVIVFEIIQDKLGVGQPEFVPNEWVDHFSSTTFPNGTEQKQRVKHRLYEKQSVLFNSGDSFLSHISQQIFFWRRASSVISKVF